MIDPAELGVQLVGSPGEVVVQRPAPGEGRVDDHRSTVGRADEVVGDRLEPIEQVTEVDQPSIDTSGSANRTTSSGTKAGSSTSPGRKDLDHDRTLGRGVERAGSAGLEVAGVRDPR